MTLLNNYEVIIAGAGPAGSSAAIHLANGGKRVLLVEQKKFPRAKLCGEFISPECRHHFRRLGVEADINKSQPATLNETVFYSLSGRRIEVPSEWFVSQQCAVGLSRAEMDHLLLQRAKNLGVEVMEETSVADVLLAGDRVVGVRLKVNGTFLDKYAPITIDATGRARLLVRRVSSRSLVAPGKTKLVAFKAHLKHTRVAEGACEIYSYRNGYGGLTRIENDLSNLCFITAAEDVKHFGSDPETVLQEIVLRNRRAAYTLDEASVCSDWLSVSLESFGRKAVAPFSGLLAVGDAAAFIDPFTGSGILMALESGELVAEVILSQQTAFKEMLAPDSLADQYRQNHYRKFHSRLRMARMLRRAAYLPQAADFAIALFGASDRLRRITARATR